MNNIHYKKTSEFIDYINKLNNEHDSEWSKHTPEQLYLLVQRHLEILIHADRPALQNALDHLNNRIKNTWQNDIKANALSATITKIHAAVEENISKRDRFKITSAEWSELPDEMWGEILSHIPPNATDYEKFAYEYGKSSGLEQSSKVSKKFEAATYLEYNKWVSKNLINLSEVGCRNAKEAVAFAIKHQLTGVNLLEFDDLEDQDLIDLFNGCPKLDQLVINSKKITTLPSQAIRLQTLLCQSCDNLKNLPDLPKLQALDCSFCSSLTSLPAMPLLQGLECVGCTGLKNLPNLPLLELLDCCKCSNLEDIPDLPFLQMLLCTTCPKLKNLPLTPLLQFLKCSGCPISTFPELTHLQVLSCAGCPTENLPESPLRELDCSACTRLTHLPENMPFLKKLVCARSSVENLPVELPEIEEINCSATPLKSLPEKMPFLIKLYCSYCPNLTRLSELPLVKELHVSGTSQLRSIPELPSAETFYYYGCPDLELPDLSHVAIVVPEIKRNPT